MAQRSAPKEEIAAVRQQVRGFFRKETEDPQKDDLLKTRKNIYKSEAQNREEFAATQPDLLNFVNNLEKFETEAQDRRSKKTESHEPLTQEEKTALEER